MAAGASPASPPEPPETVPSASAPPADPPENRWITYLNFALIVVGVALILVSTLVPAEGSLGEILLGFGLALAPGGVLGLIADYFVFGTLIRALYRSTRTLDDKNQRLGAEIAELRVSTEFLKRTSDFGLQMIYPDRRSALRDFTPYLWKEVNRQGGKGRIVIVGSSLKGLFENVPDFARLVGLALEGGHELNILLTYPKYSRYRERQEGRPPGAIEDEIFEGIRMLEGCRPVADTDAPDHPLGDKVRLYKGTPTIFMLVAGGHMLLNPYPYGEEAYRSFCFLVRRVEARDSSIEVDRTIYAQYLRAHFEKVWLMNTVPYRGFPLEGPEPGRRVDRDSSYGDVYVAQDVAHFYLAVSLGGRRDAQVPGMPTSIPCDTGGGGGTYLHLPARFSIRLLTRSLTWRSLDDTMGYLQVLPDRRVARASQEIEGNLLNDYLVLGLFDASDGEHAVVSPFRYDGCLPYPGPRDEPLPLFFVRLWSRPDAPATAG